MRHDLLPTLTNINPSQMRQFLALIRDGTYDRAAHAANTSSSAVRASIDALRKAFHDPLIEPDPDGGRAHWRATGRGREVADAGREWLRSGERLGQLADRRQSFKLAFLPHHSEFIAPVHLFFVRQHKLDHDSVIFAPHVLGEEDRSEEEFQRHVIGGLRSSRYDMVIGPPALDHDDLEQHVLYDASMVALVPAARQEPVTYRTLASDPQMNLFLPPATTRAGRTIRKQLADEGMEDGDDDRVILQDAYGITVLGSYAMVWSEDFTAVVPSDIAHSFNATGRLGGLDGQDRYKWVKVVKRDGRPLQHRVFATARRRTARTTGPDAAESAMVDQVLDRIRQEVLRLHSEFTTVRGHDGQVLGAPGTTETNRRLPGDRP